MATIKLQKQASLLKSRILDLQAWTRWNKLFLEWLIPAFTKCGSIELHQSSFTTSKNPTFPKVFCQQIFQSVKDLLRSGRPLTFITEHKFNHKFEIAVIQITLEYYRLPTARCLVEQVQILLQNWMLLIWNWSGGGWNQRLSQNLGLRTICTFVFKIKSSEL